MVIQMSSLCRIAVCTIGSNHITGLRIMFSLECIVKVKNNIVEVETYNIDFPNLVYFSTKKISILF